jgi:hypothetical protein
MTWASHPASIATPREFSLDAMQKLRDVEEEFETTAVMRLKAYPRTALLVKIDNGS